MAKITNKSMIPKGSTLKAQVTFRKDMSIEETELVLQMLNDIDYLELKIGGDPKICK